MVIGDRVPLSCALLDSVFGDAQDLRRPVYSRPDSGRMSCMVLRAVLLHTGQQRRSFPLREIG